MGKTVASPNLCPQQVFAFIGQFLVGVYTGTRASKGLRNHSVDSLQQMPQGTWLMVASSRIVTSVMHRLLKSDSFCYCQVEVSPAFGQLHQDLANQDHDKHVPTCARFLAYVIM